MSFSMLKLYKIVKLFKRIPNLRICVLLKCSIKFKITSQPSNFQTKHFLYVCIYIVSITGNKCNPILQTFNISTYNIQQICVMVSLMVKNMVSHISHIHPLQHFPCIWFLIFNHIYWEFQSEEDTQNQLCIMV